MHKVKGCKLFRQFNTRWGSVGYPYSPYCVSDSGCGPTSCAEIIVSIPKNKDITPKDTAKWLVKQGCAIAGQGTTYDGITKCLKHYGFTVKVYSGSDSNGFLKAANKKNRCGILLFHEGTKGGVTWTTGGHYVAFSGFKKDNGKHYFYTLDPGPNRNDGWHCYEDTMEGNPRMQVWVCYSSETSSTTKNDTDTDDDSNNGPALEIDWEKLNPYIISVDRNTTKKDVDYTKLKDNKIVAVMIEAGRYFTSGHKVAKTFRNPKVYEQAVNCINNGLEFGFYFKGRARSAAEAEKELYDLSFIVRRCPPTLGVWVDVDLTDKKTVNDIVLKTYEKGFLRLGLADKYGIYCNRKFLKKISWDKFQDTWWLWLKDKVDAKKEIETLIDPKFFDTDNKSGPIIGDPDRKYGGSNNKTKQGDGKYTGKFQRPIKKGKYMVSQEFGHTSFDPNHLGIDLSTFRKPGIRVSAADGGKVTLAAYSGSYGNCILIKHDKHFTTRYAHLQSFNCKKGDKVSKGQKIGEVDSTGNSTGHHLHFEVIVDGKVRNPRDYVDL